jgi:hypothetical protein
MISETHTQTDILAKNTCFRTSNKINAAVEEYESPWLRENVLE